MKDKKWFIIIAALVLMIAVAAGIGIHDQKKVTIPLDSTPVQSGSADKDRGTPKLIKVEREITVDMIQEGIRDMGFLITQEYDYTGVIHETKDKSIFNLTIPFTETSYVVTYDAVAEAGIDLTAVTVEKDDKLGMVRVSMPAAVIKSVVIDHDSFTLLSEKNGIGTKISVTDYNDSLKAFEDEVRSKALQKGILEKAEKNAELMVRNFILTLVDPSEYSVTFI